MILFCCNFAQTGEMFDAEAIHAGLVPTHAYAMLDIGEVKGVGLFMLKNTWSHLKWRGKYVLLIGYQTLNGNAESSQLRS